MDELLQARVKQLKEIDERLQTILRRGIHDSPWKIIESLRDLRVEITDMIRVAEAEHDAF